MRFMTRLLTMMAVMVATTVIIAAGPEDGVKEAGAGWRQGAIKQDKALLEKYLADDLVYTHGGGQTETKAQYIANVTKGPSHYLAMEPSETRVRIYGKTGGAVGPRGRDACERRDLSHADARGLHAEPAGLWQMSQKESVRVAVEIENWQIGRLADWQITKSDEDYEICERGSEEEWHFPPTPF